MKLEFPDTHPFHVAKTQVSLPNGTFIRALPFVPKRNSDSASTRWWYLLIDLGEGAGEDQRYLPAIE